MPFALPPLGAQSDRTAHRGSQTSTRLRGLTVATAVWVSAVFCLAPAHAQTPPAPYQDVQRLLQSGDTAQALERAQAWLVQQPKDPQMRFLKGVILNEQKHTDAALETFVQLTRDYPELPEPYNNLAVLHASAGRLDQAREALEMALHLNPSYTTAQHNLGDVYTQLAAQAYRKAQTLEPDNAAVYTKLKALGPVLNLSPR